MAKEPGSVRVVPRLMNNIYIASKILCIAFAAAALNHLLLLQYMAPLPPSVRLVLLTGRDGLLPAGQPVGGDGHAAVPVQRPQRRPQHRKLDGGMG